MQNHVSMIAKKYFISKISTSRKHNKIAIQKNQRNFHANCLISIDFLCCVSVRYTLCARLFISPV